MDTKCRCGICEIPLSHNDALVVQFPGVTYFACESDRCQTRLLQESDEAWEQELADDGDTETD